MGITHGYNHTLTIQPAPRQFQSHSPTDPIAELYPDLQERIQKELTLTKAIKRAYTNIQDIKIAKEKCEFTAVTYMGESDRRRIGYKLFQIDLELESEKPYYAQMYAALKVDADFIKPVDV
jgi:hypothetical protein